MTGHVVVMVVQYYLWFFVDIFMNKNMYFEALGTILMGSLSGAVDYVN